MHIDQDIHSTIYRDQWSLYDSEWIDIHSDKVLKGPKNLGADKAKAGSRQSLSGLATMPSLKLRDSIL